MRAHWKAVIIQSNTSLIPNPLHGADILSDICVRAAAEAISDRTLYEMSPTCLGYKSCKAYKVIMVISAGTKSISVSMARHAEALELKLKCLYA